MAEAQLSAKSEEESIDNSAEIAESAMEVASPEGPNPQGGNLSWANEMDAEDAINAAKTAAETSASAR